MPSDQELIVAILQALLWMGCVAGALPEAT
jgi:hypothetical protein